MPAFAGDDEDGGSARAQPGLRLLQHLALGHPGGIDAAGNGQALPPRRLGEGSLVALADGLDVVGDGLLLPSDGVGIVPRNGVDSRLIGPPWNVDGGVDTDDVGASGLQKRVERVAQRVFRGGLDPPPPLRARRLRGPRGLARGS